MRTANCAQEFALHEALGVSVAGKIAGPRTYDFMSAVQDGPLTQGLPKPLILSPVYYARVRPVGATPVIRFLEKRLGPYREIPPVSADPALTVNQLGKGTVVYASGDLGNTIANFHMKDSLAIVENAVAELAPGRPRLEGAPGTVELVHRSKDDGARHIFHLINFTGEMTRPDSGNHPGARRAPAASGPPASKAGLYADGEASDRAAPKPRRRYRIGASRTAGIRSCGRGDVIVGFVKLVSCNISSSIRLARQPTGERT